MHHILSFKILLTRALDDRIERGFDDVDNERMSLYTTKPNQKLTTTVVHIETQLNGRKELCVSVVKIYIQTAPQTDSCCNSVSLIVTFKKALRFTNK
jgi:hypothetical protein